MSDINTSGLGCLGMIGLACILELIGIPFWGTIIVLLIIS